MPSWTLTIPVLPLIRSPTLPAPSIATLPVVKDPETELRKIPSLTLSSTVTEIVPDTALTSSKFALELVISRPRSAGFAIVTLPAANGPGPLRLSIRIPSVNEPVPTVPEVNRLKRAPVLVFTALRFTATPCVLSTLLKPEPGSETLIVPPPVALNPTPVVVSTSRPPLKLTVPGLPVTSIALAVPVLAVIRPAKFSTPPFPVISIALAPAVLWVTPPE